YHYGRRTDDRSEVVLLSHVLAHEINSGYHDVKGAVVASVNGRPIRDMTDMVAAFDAPIGRYHVVELDAGGIRPYDSHAPRVGRIVIDAERAASVEHEILKRHGIHADRSENLK